MLIHNEISIGLIHHFESFERALTIINTAKDKSNATPAITIKEV